MRTVLPRQARFVPSEAKLVYKGIIFDVYHWQKPAFDGTPTTYEMLKRPDTVVVLAIKDGQLVISEEHHAEIPEPFLGIPGGRHDRESETELDAAKRELAEETGLTFKAWKLLDVRQVEGKIEHFVYYFLATDFDHEVPTHLDAGERVSVRLVDIGSVKALSDSPRIRFISEVILSRVSSVQELEKLPEYQA
jgi:ADP-ribose diphosphatase